MPALLNVASGEWRAIQGISSDFARYAPSGHLLYQKDESVFAVTVSLASGTTTGAPEALFDGVLAERGLRDVGRRHAGLSPEFDRHGQRGEDLDRQSKRRASPPWWMTASSN